MSVRAPFTSASKPAPAGFAINRRQGLQQILSTACAPLLSLAVQAPLAARAAGGAPKAPVGPITSSLCDAECAGALQGADRVTLSSGLAYQDIVVGRGAKPVTGYQVTLNYVVMTAAGRAFDDSVAKGTPYDIRYGVGSVVPGLDEGLKEMRVGGTRRIFVPGSLAFPRALPAAAGRPRVDANSPVIFDVQLLYIPGFDDEDEG